MARTNRSVNTEATPHRRAWDGIDRRYQWCQCKTCKVIAKCTPLNDFWAKKGGDLLECEHCFFTKVGVPGLAGVACAWVEKVTKS